MLRKKPPPSKAAERLKEYLDIIDAAQVKRGKTLRYDFYRKAGTQFQTDRIIGYLEENGLIDGNARAIIAKKEHRPNSERRRPTITCPRIFLIFPSLRVSLSHS